MRRYQAVHSRLDGWKARKAERQAEFEGIQVPDFSLRAGICKHLQLLLLSTECAVHAARNLHMQCVLLSQSNVCSAGRDPLHEGPLWPQCSTSEKSRRQGE